MAEVIYDRIIQIVFAPKGSLNESDEYDCFVGLSERGNLYWIVNNKWEPMKIPLPKLEY